jgi:broad specificity phosphatase PhoE
MNIFLVRHGEAAAAWGQDPNPGLSALGAQQAVAAAQLLLPRLDDSVKLVSSPLQRAQETAIPFSDALGLEVSVDKAFSEIPAPVPLAQRQQWLRGFMQQNWAEQPDELVLWRDNALNQLRCLETTTVVFTHFLVLNAVVGQIQKRTKTLCFGPDNASITQLRLSEEHGLQLVALGAQMDTFVN